MAKKKSSSTPAPTADAEPTGRKVFSARVLPATSGMISELSAALGVNSDAKALDALTAQAAATFVAFDAGGPLSADELRVLGKAVKLAGLPATSFAATTTGAILLAGAVEVAREKLLAEKAMSAEVVNGLAAKVKKLNPIESLWAACRLYA